MTKLINVTISVSLELPENCKFDDFSVTLADGTVIYPQITWTNSNNEPVEIPPELNENSVDNFTPPIIEV